MKKEIKIKWIFNNRLKNFLKKYIYKRKRNRKKFWSIFISICRVHQPIPTYLVDDDGRSGWRTLARHKWISHKSHSRVYDMTHVQKGDDLNSNVGKNEAASPCLREVAVTERGWACMRNEKHDGRGGNG